MLLPGDQLDEPSAIVEGYNAYFSFSKVRSGYSGNYVRFPHHKQTLVSDNIFNTVFLITHSAHKKTILLRHDESFQLFFLVFI